MYNFRLSLRDIYNYDESIFDDLVLPTSQSVTLDKTALVEYILKESDFFNLVSWYSDPVKIKQHVGTISKINSQKWKHILDIWCASYNAIHNYDMLETENYEGEHDDATTRDIDNTTSNTSTETTSNTGEGIGYVNTYNDDTFHTNNKTTTEESVSDSVSGSGTNNTDEQSTWNGTEEWTRTLTRAGNIGVMSTQNMMEQELALWKKLDIYKTICDDVVGELCTLVYA